jgi:hypothetical protein
MDKSLKYQAKTTTIKPWGRPVGKQIIVSESHVTLISSEALRALRASTPEEYVRNYARSKLSEAVTVFSNERASNDKTD